MVQLEAFAWAECWVVGASLACVLCSAPLYLTHTAYTAVLPLISLLREVGHRAQAFYPVYSTTLPAVCASERLN